MKKLLVLLSLVAMMAVVGCNKNQPAATEATTETAVTTEAAAQ